MTTRWPSGRFLALTHTCSYRPHPLRPIRHVRSLRIRQYASQSPKPSTRITSQIQSSANASDFDVQSTLQTVVGTKKLDPLNPPPSTRPPPLHLPTRGPENVLKYYWSIGRAYGTFYKNGIKSVWYNYRGSKMLANRLKMTYKLSNHYEAVWNRTVARSEYLVLLRSQRDVAKLPFFGLLVLIFGEWLPLIVPFIPNAVPSTCRIPKQVEGMRRQTEERRRVSFRSGVKEPSRQQIEPAQREDHETWCLIRDLFRLQLLECLRADQILHLSTTFNLHGSLWDRLGIPPPTFLLRYRVNEYIAWVIADDYLLLGYQSFDKLHHEELLLACEQRGMDVLGKSEDTLRKLLSMWIAMQRQDEGRGTAFLLLLFRRCATILSKC